MFRITENPSSGSIVQCLVKNYKNCFIVSLYREALSSDSTSLYSELHTRTPGQIMLP